MQKLHEAQKLAQAVLLCDFCDLSPEAHQFQSRVGLGFHEWEPGRAQRVIEREAGKLESA